MSLLPRLLLFSLLTTALAIGTACTVQPGNSPSNSNVPVTQASPPASPSPSPTASPATTQASVQITLPLLDALLADEAFVRETRTRLKLSDEQIDSLKHASQAEIDRLRASNAEETDTDGTDAPTRAAE